MGIFGRSPPTAPFESRPLINEFLSSPLRFLLYNIYHLFLFLRGPSYDPSRRSSTFYEPLKIVCISDTHCKTTSVPTGDLLIHAGDLAENGTVSEIGAQLDWLASLPHTHKVVICGNHDGYFDPRSRAHVDPKSKLDLTHYSSTPSPSLHYLQHSSITLDFHTKDSPAGQSQPRRLTLYGAPQIPACGGPDFAFQYPRGRDAWSDTIPSNIDVLVTHTPPKWHHDLPHGQGCEHLLRECWRVKPRLHVFGHVHADPGLEYVWWDESQRAYERVMSRGYRTFIGDLLSIGNWIDGLRILIYGVRGILWHGIWGGNRDGSIMVNSALSVGSTGKLGNPPVVVYL